MSSTAWGSHQPSSRPGGASLAAGLRQVLLWASRRRQIKRVITAAPVTRDVVRRFVAGETIDDAIRATRDLTGKGLLVSLDHLGEDTLDAAAATAAVEAYRSLARRLAGEGLAASAEMSVKLSAVGQALDESMAPRQRTADLRGGARGGHVHHGGHGGPHHHRFHARHRGAAAEGLPVDGRGAAGLAAPHRVRLPGARCAGVARPPLQGRVPGAGVARVAAGR